jgi:signal transduction histidine kinase
MACVHIQFPERASPNEPPAILAKTNFLDEATVHKAGLGCLLARALVDLHGGTIAAMRKEESPGTTVSIFLPRAGCLPGNRVA